MNMLQGFVTAIGLLLAQSALAEFPNWYPQEGFQRYGEIEGMDPDKKIVFIKDHSFFYTEGTIVHSLSEKSDSQARIHTGATIGFTFDRDEQGHKIIREIWLLPENYSQPED